MDSLREGSLLDLTAADTGGADANAFTRAFDYRVYRLKIQVPTTLRHIVGMTDAMPELRPAATNFTNFCHINTPPLNQASGNY